MIRRRKQALLVGILLIVSPAAARAQTHVDVLWDLYEQSVLYPEDFDFYLLERLTMDTSPFDESFRAHTDQAMARLAAQSRQHREFCDQYADSRSRWDCLQRETAASVLVWLTCLDVAVFHDGVWSDTQCGQNQILGKRIMEQMGVDMSVLRGTTSQLEPTFRAAVR